MCMRHELSAAHTTSAPVSSTAAHLVGEHRRRHLRVLHRERPAEAAALVVLRQVHQLDAPHRLEQAPGPVAHLELAQRVAGRVEGHAVREVRPHVVDPEAVHDQLRELVDGRPLVPELLAQHARARRGRRDHRLGAVEHAREAPGQREPLARVARVHVHLPAAGLLEREVHLAAEPLEQRHDGLPVRGNSVSLKQVTKRLTRTGGVLPGYKNTSLQKRRCLRFRGAGDNRGGMRRSLALRSALAMVACICATAAAAPTASAVDIYSFANGCYALKDVPAGRYVVKDATGYAASATTVAAATPFRMQATALGRYLMYGPDGRMPPPACWTRSPATPSRARRPTGASRTWPASSRSSASRPARSSA